MSDNLGIRPAGSTVRFKFTTHAASGAAVAPSSAFETADIRIYKDGSDVQRSSANGITMTSPFDSVTGLHHVDIDLSDDSDSGFYAAGSVYAVVLVPDETVDSLAVVKVLAYFEIGVPVANVTQFGGSAGTFSGGRPEVNATHWGGTAVASAVILAASNISDGALTAAKFASGAFDAVWSVAARLLTAGTNIVLAKGTGVTGFNDLDAAGVRGAVGLASANLDTQLGALDTVVDAIQVKTDNLPSDPADQSLVIAATTAIIADTEDIQSRLPAALVSGRIDASVGAMQADVVTATAIAADAIGASELAASAVSEIQSGLSTLDAAGVRAAVGLASANLDTQLGAIDTVVDAVKAKTDALPAAPAATGDIPTANQNADALLDRADAVETSVTPRGALRLATAALAGKVSGAGSLAPVFRNVGDTKNRITASTDAAGNRTAVTVDAS